MWQSTVNHNLPSKRQDLFGRHLLFTRLIKCTTALIGTVQVITVYMFFAQQQCTTAESSDHYSYRFVIARGGSGVLWNT